MNKKTTLRAFALIAAFTVATTVTAAPIAGQGTWQTTLQARDLNSDGITDAFYDSTLNITWASNANINGLMTWDAANTWANNVSIGGVTGWRLPTMVDTGTAGCDYSITGTDCGYNVQTRAGGITYSEMAHLYYVTLGNLTYCRPGSVGSTTCVPQTGYGLGNTANFANFDQYGYWSGLEYVSPSSGLAWYFRTDTYDGAGYQDRDDKDYQLSGLAVRSGDAGVATAVPIAPTVVLLLPLLMGLVVRTGRRTG